jgi:hypothetical protein
MLDSDDSDDDVDVIVDTISILYLLNKYHTAANINAIINPIYMGDFICNECVNITPIIDAIIKA